jgi:hypothetical protein
MNDLRDGGGGSGLVLVSNDSMGAQRAPWAILWMWAYQTLAASVLAWPVASLVRTVFGRHPQGDAPLWTPGALSLADFLVASERALQALVPLHLFGAVVAALGGFVPLLMLIAQMTFATRQGKFPGLRLLTPKALGLLPGVLRIGLLFGAVELVLLGGGAVVGMRVADAFTASLGDAHAAQVGLAVGLLFAILASAVGVVHDLARTALVRFPVGAWECARLALRTGARAPVLLYWAWAWRALFASVLLVAGSVLSERVGGLGGGPLLALFVVHQAIVFGRVVLRASWLGRALRAVDLTHKVVMRPAA